MTEKRFENRLNKTNERFHALSPVWDNEKQDGLSVFEMIDLLNALHEENQSIEKDHERQTNEIKLLRSKITEIQTTIQQAYETERTELGKSVLKQLLETI